MKQSKRIILALLVAIMSFGAANAQLRFGVKAGLNLNSLHFSDVASNLKSDNQCGWTGGVMTEFQVPVIGLAADLSVMYTHMGAAPKFNKEDVDINKDFIEIPLNLKYKFGLPIVGNFLTPYLYTGPSFAFRLKHAADNFKTKSCQTAWNVGVGVEIIKHLQIQGSYGFGMNNIANKIVSGINTENVKAKNNYWTVSAAWLF